MSQSLPELVMVSAWGVPATHLLPLAHELPEFRTHRIDLPGFGERQDDVPSPWTLDSVTADLAGRLERLDGERLVLVGSSIGGTIALAYAALQPPKLAGVVAIGASARFTAAPDYPIGMPAEAAAQMVAAGRADLVGALAMTAPSAFFNDDDRASAERALQQALEAARAIRSPVQAMDILEATYAADARDRLHRIAVPVLLLYGERDVITPESHAVYMRERISAAESESLPGAGHLPALTAPRATAERIRSFVGRL